MIQRALQESYADASYEESPSIDEKINTVLDAFKDIADEIISGYESGTRVRFVEDSTSDDGYRKLTQEDELAILQDEFDEFVERRFGWNLLQTNLPSVHRLRNYQQNF